VSESPPTPSPSKPAATSVIAPTTGAAFESLTLPAELHAGIRDAGFTHCTPIQDKVFPLSLKGRDVAGQAQTGTGKTAAFLITVFNKLLANPRVLQPGTPRALIIAPTRELVVQIAQDGKVLGGHTGLVIHAVYGGVDYRKQRDRIAEGIDVLIGTPGRLIDYMKQRVYTLRRTEALVIDEADRMFDMGFIRDLRFMLRRLPPVGERQSMLFSATLSYQVLELAYEHMNDPTHVSASSAQVTAEKIDHLVYHVGTHQKLSLLVGILRHETSERVLIFTNMRRTAQQLVDALKANEVDAAPITGDMEQRKRLSILEQFKTGQLPVLVATDVASRGLHIEGVTHVINYDLPQDPEDYVHRTGRTARAGAEGTAISLASEDAFEALEPIETLIGFKLPYAIPEEDALVRVVHPPRRRRSRDSTEERRPHRGRQAEQPPRRHAHGRQRDAAPDQPPRQSPAGAASPPSRRRRRGRSGKPPQPGGDST
jgi:ATP-dependent RNA helicase RhlB